MKIAAQNRGFEMAENAQKIRDRAYQLWEEQGRPEGRETDHWAEAERQVRPGVNEGEGSQTGARAYNEATREFVASGWVAAAAQEAENSLDDEAEAAELRRAEATGKSHSHGEDPVLTKKLYPRAV
jgi:hypothetical protein